MNLIELDDREVGEPPRKKRKTLPRTAEMKFGTFVCFCKGPTADVNYGAGEHQEQNTLSKSTRKRCHKKTMEVLQNGDARAGYVICWLLVVG